MSFSHGLFGVKNRQLYVLFHLFLLCSCRSCPAVYHWNYVGKLQKSNWDWYFVKVQLEEFGQFYTIRSTVWQSWQAGGEHSERLIIFRRMMNALLWSKIWRRVDSWSEFFIVKDSNPFKLSSSSELNEYRVHKREWTTLFFFGCQVHKLCAFVNSTRFEVVDTWLCAFWLSWQL